MVHSPPCVLFEDDHLLVINKPGGLNTHAPSPYAGEGIYDWLRHREPRWAKLAIIHRLDKETSGVLVFSKTALSNKSLHDQFAGRRVEKTYWLATDGVAPAGEKTVRSSLVRAGDRYVSRPANAGGELAETRFRPLREPPHAVGNFKWLEAEPLTGRTHQIRVHAADSGFPVAGDTLYGGDTAARLFLHAARIELDHPADGRRMDFSAPMLLDNSEAIRAAVVEPNATNACRLVHGASDGWPGFYVERYGDFLLVQSEAPVSAALMEVLENRALQLGCTGVYWKPLLRSVRSATLPQASPQLLWGTAAPERFVVRENGLSYEMSFGEGYSVGLFLDQRDNRRRLMTRHIAAGFTLPADRPLQVLNTFAYTCGFSVAGAAGGAITTSLDLSRKYLDWGRRNLELNGMDPAAHDFIYGDVFDWLKRLGKKQRSYDVVLLDPPTFSQSKQSGVFRVQKDYPRLVETAARVLAPGGVLFASTNAADWEPEAFLDAVRSGLGKAGRRVLQEHYVPQPPDFPVSRAEPAYLKTVWVRAGGGEGEA